MKENDIIDKLNIIDRKIDELTYLNTRMSLVQTQYVSPTSS